MLSVCDVFDEFLDIHGRMHGVQVLLGSDTSLIYEVVGVCDNARDSAHHMFVNLVQFSTFTEGHEELACLFLLSGEDNTYTVNIWLNDKYLRVRGCRRLKRPN